MYKRQILDTTASETLFPEGNPLGKTVEIKGEPFVVVGLVEQLQEFQPVINSQEDYYMYVQNQSGKVFLPSSVWPILYRYDEPQMVVARAASTDDMLSLIHISYASRCIENEILMYLRRNNRIKTEVSIDEPLNVDWDGNELLLSDILGSDQDVISRRMEDEIDKELLLKSLEILNQRERAIVELRFGLKSGGREKTQKEVADLLGISQSYISRLEKKIMKRLQKEIIRML